MQEPGYEPSKLELIFQLLERAASGLGTAFHMPNYLAWGLIILILFWVLYFCILFVESIVRYIRYALIIISTMWAVGFMLALQYAGRIG